MSSAEVDEMIRRADRDGDGFVNLVIEDIKKIKD